MTTCENCDINAGDDILWITPSGDHENNDSIRLCLSCTLTLLTQHPIHDNLDTLLNSAKMTDWVSANDSKGNLTIGTFNSVKLYKRPASSASKERRVVRTAKNPSFYMIEGKDEKYSYHKRWREMIPLDKNKEKEMTQNHLNWCKASVYKLSPNLHFFGYFKDPSFNKTFLDGNKVKQTAIGVNLCIISEGYDQDLSSFYNFSKLIINKGRDEYIANQLVELLQKSAVEMGIICFDLKPSNCVINLQTNEVRLIDWDADWCFPYSYKNESREVQELNKKLSGLLSVIFMANQFITLTGLNIFHTYFNKDEYMKLFDGISEDEMLVKIKEIYCKTQREDNFVMVRHYQMDTVSDLFKRGETYDDTFDEKCNEIFDLMWMNAHY